MIPLVFPNIPTSQKTWRAHMIHVGYIYIHVVDSMLILRVNVATYIYIYIFICITNKQTWILWVVRTRTKTRLFKWSTRSGSTPRTTWKHFKKRGTMDIHWVEHIFMHINTRRIHVSYIDLHLTIKWTKGRYRCTIHGSSGVYIYIEMNMKRYMLSNWIFADLYVNK